jgi:hypothetical protein
VRREFTLLCKKLDLFDGELVGIDGSKFSAINHDSRSFTKQKIQRLLKEIDEKINHYFTRLESADTTEGNHERAIVSEHITNLQRHKEEVEQLQQMLDGSGKKSVSLTDPDSRLMVTGKHGNDVSYNVQIAVDSKHKLIVASDVTNEANDLHQLYTLAEAAKDLLEVEHLEVTADSGYYNEKQISECESNNISCYIPEPEKSQNKALGLYTDKDFYYDLPGDRYLCPANQYLNFRYQTIKGNKEIKVYETNCCRSCNLRSKCTRSRKNNRRIYRWINEDIIEAMRDRMKRQPEKVNKRKELVEHTFGTIKHWMNHGYFLMRGRKKVAAEVSMSVLVYNMKRVMNIIGIPDLLAVLKAIKQNGFSFLCSFYLSFETPC